MRLFFFVLFCLGCGGAQQAQLRPGPVEAHDRCDESREVLHPSVVRVYNGNGLCTGVVVSLNEVLTSSHCVEDDPDDTTVEYPGYNLYFDTVHVSFRGPENEDLALLTMEPDFEAFADPADISRVSADIGDVVQLVGYGCSPKHEAQYMRRLVVRPSIEETELSLAGCTCKGDSGSPVFNSYGQIVAINWAGSKSLTKAIDVHVINYLRIKL